ncbi:MAG: ferrous iron transport protein A [Oscillospiraceae bacterium]|nr:ferrous iron transport protein A [Oscillospiraceae bacterium]
MIPLVFADQGGDNVIMKIGGSQEVRQHLFDLGFVLGEKVTVINRIGGNVIVKVKESRVAISREMAEKIYV